MKTKQLILLIIMALSVVVFTRNSFGVTNEEGMDAWGKGDLNKAVNIFKALSEQGNPKAQHNLSKFYLFGKGGVPKDEKKHSV